MGIYLEIVDLEKCLRESKRTPIILNDFNFSTVEGKEKLNQLLYVKYEGETLSIQPTCDCKKYVGQYYIGIICENCQSEVQRITEKSLEPNLWLRVPDGVHSFITPQVWSIFKSKFKDALNFICIPGNKIVNNSNSGAIKKLGEMMKERGIERNLNSFYTNFDQIMDLIYLCRFIKPYTELVIMKNFIKENRNKIFTRFLPIPSRMSFVIESTATASYADENMFYVIDAVRTISSITDPIIPITSPIVLQNKTVKVIKALASYYEVFCKNSLNPKEGWFRKHVFGTRSHFTLRAVITSLSKPHHYDEIHMPWAIGVMGYRLHLINKLMKRGFNPKECNSFLNEHCKKYNALIDELLNELIRESPEKGLPVLIQRNPTLMRGSAQLFYITKFETDPEINSMATSILTLKGFNADFDGDMLNGFIINDKKTIEKLKRLSPHLNVLDLKEPYKLSNTLTLPSPVISTLSNWINSDVNA